MENSNTIRIERKRSREEIMMLGKKFREMVHDGCTASEIAKALELNESTVRSALIRLSELETGGTIG